jgi:hypothetical protein
MGICRKRNTDDYLPYTVHYRTQKIHSQIKVWLHTIFGLIFQADSFLTQSGNDLSLDRVLQRRIILSPGRFDGSPYWDDQSKSFYRIPVGSSSFFAFSGNFPYSSSRPRASCCYVIDPTGHREI